MTENKQYSLEDIKFAFWSTFHRSGDVWFDYLGDADQNNISTSCHWREFEEYLKARTK